MNWRRGITLITDNTKKWNAEKMRSNNQVEQSLIFSNFSSLDNGKSRELICRMNTSHLTYEYNALLISKVPSLLSMIKRNIKVMHLDDMDRKLLEKLIK